MSSAFDSRSIFILLLLMITNDRASLALIVTGLLAGGGG